MFKCQPGYTLRKIKGINYLLPYGQQIADLKKGFVLNETSTFLWNVLQHHEGAAATGRNTCQDLSTG